MVSVIFLPEWFAERKHEDEKITAVCIKRIMNMKEVVGLQNIFLLLVISFLMIFSATCNAGLHEYPKVAVLEFENKTTINDETLNDGKYVRELAINELLNAGHFNVMEFDAEYGKAYAQIHDIDVRDGKRKITEMFCLSNWIATVNTRRRD